MNNNTGQQGERGATGATGAVEAVGAAGAVSVADPVIAYRLGQVENAVTIGFKEHNEKLDNLVQGFVTKEFYVEQHNTIDGRVRSLENDRKWLVRLVVGAVVFSLMALLGIGFKAFN